MTFGDCPAPACHCTARYVCTHVCLDGRTANAPPHHYNLPLPSNYGLMVVPTSFIYECTDIHICHSCQSGTWPPAITLRIAPQTKPTVSGAPASITAIPTYIISYIYTTRNLLKPKSPPHSISNVFYSFPGRSAAPTSIRIYMWSWPPIQNCHDLAERSPDPHAGCGLHMHAVSALLKVQTPVLETIAPHHKQMQYIHTI